MGEKNILWRLSLSPILATESDTKYFVDRSKEVRILLDSLVYRRNVLLVGERGSGKSSLLNYIEFRQRDQPGMIIIPVSFGWNIKTPEEFVNLLLSRTLHQTQTHSTLKEKISEFAEKQLAAGQFYKQLKSAQSAQIEDQDLSYSQLGFFEKLVSLIRAQGFNIAYFVDDADKYAEAFYNATSSLRDFLWRTAATYFVSADISSLHIYKRPPLDAFFDHTVHLHELSLGETEMLINARAQGKASHEVCKMVYEHANGNPRETLKLLQTIFEDAMRHATESSGSEIETANLGTIDLQASAKAVTSSLESTLAKRRAELQELGYCERKILEYLENHGPSSSSEKDFQAYVGVKRARLVQMLRKLEKKGTLKSIRRGKKKLFFSKYSKVEGIQIG